MRKYFAVAFVLALLVVSVSGEGQCAGVRNSILVPAIVDEGTGELLELSVEVRPGDGAVYISTEPLVGIYTQSSEKTAVEVAMRLANKTKNDYDVLFKIEKSRNARVVDGPSAGAAMTVLVLASVQNKTIRKDMTMTGTVEDDGSVGEVGGILEKAKAASVLGLKYFLVPEQDPYERMVLRTLLERYDITLVEVRSINDVSEVVFAPEGTEPKKYAESTVAVQPTMNFERLPASSSREFVEFKRIVGEVVRDANGSMDALAQSKNADPAVIAYFNARLNESLELFEKNYLYSAGNNMFLARIDASLLARKNISKSDLDAEIALVEKCIADVPQKKMTNANMEWLIGAQLRLAWAEKKIAEVRESEEEDASDEEVLYAIKEALYAETWCGVAKRMGEVEFGGAPVDESKLRESARKKIKEAEDYLETRPEEGVEDALWHLGAAKDSFEKGRYGAAIFDAVYARATTEAGEEVKVENYDDAAKMTDEIMGKEMKNFWAEIYQAHAKYYRTRTTTERGEILNAYRMGKFADELETATSEMRKTLTGTEVKVYAGEGRGAGIDFGALVSIVVGVTAVGALSVCVLFLLLRKRHEHREIRAQRKKARRKVI